MNNTLLESLNKYWELYKTDYSLGTENAKNEIYKWEIFKQVFSNWNWNVEDKKSMILKAFNVNGSHNLWVSGNYFPIRMLEEIVTDFPERTIQAFDILFDSNIELIERISEFKKVFDELLILLQNKYPDRDRMRSHYQDVRIISIYLMLQFPEEFVFYKYNVAKNFFKILEKEGIKKGDDQSFVEFNQLVKEIKRFIKNDVEYLENYQKFLNDNSLYNDVNLNVLAQDFIFTVVKHFNSEIDELQISYDLKKVLIKLEHNIFDYFKVLDRIIEQLNLERDSDQYYFNYDKKQLIFTIGQRYVWNLSDNTFKYISLDKIEDFVEEFGSGKEVEAYLNYTSQKVDPDIIFDRMKLAIERELKRTVNSGFKKNNKKDFQELVFNKEFRKNVLSNIFKNKRKYFIEWLNKNFGDKNGTNNSYVRAIDILCEILKIDLFSISEIDYFDELYEDLILNQRDEAGKYYYEKAKSYGEKGFYSASIQTYKRFLSEIDNELVNINVTIPTMSKNAELLKYKKQIILQGSPGTGKTRLAKEIAKELIGVSDLNDSEQFKLLQFHPSYTYEDFVRGIVSKPNEDGDGIVYEAENKILAEFAKKALVNYKLSNENNTIEFESKSVFDAFIDSIKEELAQSEDYKYNITDAVYLFSADETRFKYKGDNWVAHSKGLNMKFSELKKIIDSGATERQDIKRMIDVEELTRQHATYFIKIVEKYYAFKQAFNESIPFQQDTELKNYVLIIDEINRANLSSVLGELIYALEYRGEAVESMYEIDGDNKLILPPNLYIIGTMNTADRSVGHIDYAIRRRFAFVDVLPKDLSNEEGINFDSKLFHQVAKLFETNLSPEFEKKDVQLGHSYFIDKLYEGGSMNIRLEFEIKPILLEYVKDGVLIGEDINQKIEDLGDSI